MKVIKRIALGIVAFVILFYVVLFGTMTYQMSRDPVVYMDDREVQYVLGWLGQDESTAVLLNSYHPPANWAGDYEKIFALRMEEAALRRAITKPGVVPGDQATERVVAAVRFAMIFTRDLPWFPREEEILTSSFYLVPVNVVMQGEYADATDIMMIHPADRTVYFVAAKM